MLIPPAVPTDVSNAIPNAVPTDNSNAVPYVDSYCCSDWRI